MNPIEEKHYKACFRSDSLYHAHVIITKETAVGFDRWKYGKDMQVAVTGEGVLFYHYDGHVLTDYELYDLYVESLKQ
jgi:hypothetical protein